MAETKTQTPVTQICSRSIAVLVKKVLYVACLISIKNKENPILKQKFFKANWLKTLCPLKALILASQ